MRAEWEDMIQEQDAVDMARKYPADAVWVHPEKGIAHGKQGNSIEIPSNYR